MIRRGGGERRRRRSQAERAALRHAKARLDRLALYSTPVRLRRTVRIVTTPWLFRLPWFSRFDGYTMWDLVLLRHPLEQVSADLICHELCHVWQMQHRPLAMPLSYLRHGYARNHYEVEARRAVELTREAPPAPAPGSGSAPPSRGA